LWQTRYHEIRREAILRLVVQPSAETVYGPGRSQWQLGWNRPRSGWSSLGLFRAGIDGDGLHLLADRVLNLHFMDLDPPDSTQFSSKMPSRGCFPADLATDHRPNIMSTQNIAVW